MANRNPHGLPPRENVRSKVQTDVYMCTCFFKHCRLFRSGLPGTLVKPFFVNCCLNNIDPSQNGITYYRKMCSRKHSPYRGINPPPPSPFQNHSPITTIPSFLKIPHPLTLPIVCIGVLIPLKHFSVNSHIKLFLP